jgi:hypothetical protein
MKTKSVKTITKLMRKRRRMRMKNMMMSLRMKKISRMDLMKERRKLKRL